jgi:hypothetical protein
MPDQSDWFAAGKASIRECVPRSSPLTQGANSDAPLRTQTGGVTHHGPEEKVVDLIMGVPASGPLALIGQ